MLRIISISDTSNSNITFSYADRERNLNILLLTFNLTDSAFLQELNEHILQKVKGNRLYDVSESDLESVLQELFIEMNWQLYAKFHRTETYECGVSLLLLVNLNKRCYLVQFGRLLCGRLKGHKLEYIGKKWDNFKIKTKADLFLLGSRDEDIFVKVITFEIPRKQMIIAIPSIYAEQLSSGINTGNIRRRIRRLYNKQPFSYFLLASEDFHYPKRSGFFYRVWRKICGKE
ncbi:MAG: hypothetical protein JW784_03960 [Candidatus Cloacimonetes bacterium]|nr:hypothetical protein [Candidatus Cloacimonadota bacterium]